MLVPIYLGLCRAADLNRGHEAKRGRMTRHDPRCSRVRSRRTDIPNIARPLLIHFDRFLPALTAADDPIRTG